MLTRWIPGLALLCLAAPVVPTRAADAAKTQPLIVVRVKSLDALVASGRYLAELAGAKERAKQVEAMIRDRVGDKGLEGIDTKRPFGFYANDVNTPFPVVMVPIKDQKAFLKFLKNLGVDAEKPQNGLYTVKLDFLPGEPEAYFRFANDYAYLTVINTGPLDKDRLAGPALLKLTGPNALASATFHLNRLPASLKGVAIDQVKDRIDKAKDKKPARETADQERVRLQILDDVAAALTSIIKDGGLVTLQLDVNPSENKLGLELSLTGKPDSKLAQTIAHLGEDGSLFTTLLGGKPAAAGLLHFTVPRDLKRTLGPIIDKGMKQALEKESDDDKRALTEKVFKAIRPTLEAGELDLMGALRGPSKDGLYTAVLGLKVRDGLEIDKVVQDVLKNIKGSPKSEIDKKIKLNVDKVGGVAIHQIILKDDLDPSFRRLYGEAPAYFAFRKDALFVTLGEGSLDAIKEALASKPKAGPVFALEVSIAQLVPLIKQGKDRAAARVASDAFPEDSKDPGLIRFTLEGGKALKARLSATGGVVKFFSRLARRRQMQAEAAEAEKAQAEAAKAKQEAEKAQKEKKKAEKE